MKAMLKKELRSYFFSPIGYVVVGLILFLFGLYFWMGVLRAYSSYYIPSIYQVMLIWFMMIIPVLTMRSFSEEMRNKTDQGLLTFPLSVGTIVFGKFISALVVFAIAIVGSLIPVIIMSFFSSPDWAAIMGTVLGTLLYGAAMISIGIFISSLTQSQIVAAVGTFGVSVLLLLMDTLSSYAQGTFIAKILTWISFSSRYQPFSNGILNISSIVFFLSVTAVFTFLTARKIESRRWN